MSSPILPFPGPRRRPPAVSLRQLPPSTLLSRPDPANPFLEDTDATQERRSEGRVETFLSLMSMALSGLARVLPIPRQIKEKFE